MCKCESNFTCGDCLQNAPPWIFTPIRPEYLNYLVQCGDIKLQPGE